MGFQSALSGLNGASKAIDVISNNIANSSTVGFKGGLTVFGDIYAAALNGASSNTQVGIGTSVGAITQSFNQGNISPTDNPLDVAINGNGFFRIVKSDGTVGYSRNGQFNIDKSGFLVNATGFRLTGYPADPTGRILPASPTAIQLDTSDLAPKVTSAIDLGVNLDSRATTPSVAFASTPAQPLPDPLSYNSSTSVSVFDSLGNAHIMTTYFVKSGGGNWDLYTSMDGDVATGPTALNFDASGTLTTTMPLNVTAAIDPVYGAISPMTFELDLTGTTQYGAAFGVNKQLQDGYSSGRLSGVTIGADGTLQGRYSNGASKVLGQIVLANFANPNGLISMGQNIWAEAPESGQPIVGAPNTGTLGMLQSGALEESNTDLTASLVNLITQQRNYQANSQSIKTQDTILNTLVNLG